MHVSSFRVRLNLKMALLQYLRRNDIPVPKVPLPSKLNSLSQCQLQQVNDHIRKTVGDEATSSGIGKKRCHGYNQYSDKERAEIGKYAAENGATKACRHFTKKLGKPVPESTARRLTTEYLAVLGTKIRGVDSKSREDQRVCVSDLPKKVSGRPLLLGEDLDATVREFVESLRKVGGVVNTSIVMAAAEGTVAAKNPFLLVVHGGHIQISKGWVKLLFHRIGYVKRKGSNAGKVTVAHFQEQQEVFLADIKAEVLMNDVPQQLVFNWDQTAVHYVPTGQWTMHRYKEKITPIANSDDKRQITAVLAITLTGEFLPPQMIYQGKTPRCHPKVPFPK